MIIIRKVHDKTPRGRQWITQISLNTKDIRKGETMDSALNRQINDNSIQLAYERTYLL